MQNKVKVLVVDDSMMMRRMISRALESDPRVEVIAEASNGEIALREIEKQRPDLVVLDLEMPVMDGHETTVAIRERDAKLPIIIFSSASHYGAHATFDTLDEGANDFIAKPQTTSGIQETRSEVREALLPKVHALAGGRSSVADKLAEKMGISTAPARSTRAERVDILCIASSTGGPEALSKVLAALPGDLPVPVVCVQHMPETFSKAFAERVNTLAALRVKEAEDRDVLEPGAAFIAPGNSHIKLRKYGEQVKILTDQGPKEHHCRPAADVLLRSVPEIYGAHVLSVVLTGMGKDGLLGCQQVHAAGGQVLVQDQATSVVWGMPGAVANAGVADEVLPLGELPAAVIKRIKARRN